MSKKDKMWFNSASLLKLNLIEPSPLTLLLNSTDLLKMDSNFLLICLSSVVNVFSIRVVLGVKFNFSLRANSSTWRTDNSFSKQKEIRYIEK